MEPLAPLETILPKLHALGVVLPPGALRVCGFGDSAALSSELLQLISEGRKRGGAALLWSYEADNESVPATGEMEIVLDHRNEPVLITRISVVEVVPFHAVSAAFASREGEGDGSLAFWRAAHWAFFSRECARLNRQAHDTMPVVCTSFELLQVLTPPLSA